MLCYEGHVVIKTCFLHFLYNIYCLQRDTDKQFELCNDMQLKADSILCLNKTVVKEIATLLSLFSNCVYFSGK